MSNPTEMTTVSKPMTVRALRRHLDRRVFAIPELQREFVWKDQKIPVLLDSMYRGYPIGAALVWRTRREKAGSLRKRLHILPQYDPSNPEVWFLLDGQQRISVLHQLLAGGDGAVKVGKREIDFRRAYFSPASGGGKFGWRQRHPEGSVSVVDLLSDRWRTKLAHLGKRDHERVHACRDQLLGYRFQLTFVDAKELESVRNAFVRINAQGTPLRGADQAFARATKVNLRHRVRDLQAELKYGFDGLDDRTILQTVGIILDSKDVGQRAVERVLATLEEEPRGAEKVTRIWQRLRGAFAEACDYVVRKFGVPDRSAMPSDTMLSVLATFFYFNRGRQPSREVAKVLSRWFWASAVTGRYTGRGFRRNLVSDVHTMRKLAEKKPVRFRHDKLPLSDLWRTDYRRGSLAAAFTCLLRLQQPRYLEDGEQIMLGEHSARANRRDRHHVFPRKLLSESGVSDRSIDALANICFLVARENQSVGRRDPRSYLEDVPANRRVLTRVARSHLIPLNEEWQDADLSVKQSFKRFSRDRAHMIAAAFEKRAGAKLFTR